MTRLPEEAFQVSHRAMRMVPEAANFARGRIVVAAENARISLFGKTSPRRAGRTMFLFPGEHKSRIDIVLAELLRRTLPFGIRVIRVSIRRCWLGVEVGS